MFWDAVSVVSILITYYQSFESQEKGIVGGPGQIPAKSRILVGHSFFCGAYCWYFLFCPFVKMISWAWTQMCCKLIILTWLQKYHMMCAMGDLIAYNACCIWLTRFCSLRNMRDDASSFCASSYCRETKMIYSSRWDAVCTLISSVGCALLLSPFS